ncbi:Salicylaldehyde dehydrogenase, partial [Lachnellula willkommii]
IFKAHELSPLTHSALVNALHDAGLPPGVLNLLAHAPAHAAEVTRQLVEDPRIKKINFTGSTGVGRIIAQMAGRCLKPVLLELGGKAPAIVWADADVGLAARECALGAFLHAGQVCMSTERIIVHSSISDEFEAAFKAAIGDLGLDGAAGLINRASVLKNQRLVADAVLKGASLLHGSMPDTELGAHMAPVIVKNPSRDADIFATESFGPTVSLYTVSSEEEAWRWRTIRSTGSRLRSSLRI